MSQNTTETYAFLRVTDLDKGQAEWFERQVMRCLALAGWDDLRHVGRSWDGGADIVGLFRGERWVVQIKARKASGAINAIQDVERAAAIYKVRKGLAVSRGKWTDSAKKAAGKYGSDLQLINGAQLITALEEYPMYPSDSRTLFNFQEDAVTELLAARSKGQEVALIAMATGLGKTVVAAEYVEKILTENESLKVLVLAHSEDILKQSEKSFWKHLPRTISTHQINARERPHRTDGVTFATFQTMSNIISSMPDEVEFDTVIVDECHHAAARSYIAVIRALAPNYLVGLTATPWRADEKSLRNIFGDAIYSKSIIEAMNQGWLSEVDYRLLIDNIPWKDFPKLSKTSLTVKQLNSLFFIPQLEEAIIQKIYEHWENIDNPQTLVFCKTIRGAERIAGIINRIGFAKAEVISSKHLPGERRIDREIKLMKFRDGEIDILCGVDVFNEGIDVPDVNLLVFLRVTHSRRIFVQQLGRGLRWKKNKVVRVLDFVSDIRRIAALIKMESENEVWRSNRPVEVLLQDQIIHFSNDKQASFFKEWLKDVAELEDASESSELSFPSIVT